jgi:N-acetylmuramoyl-L-alanine amidase
MPENSNLPSTLPKPTRLRTVLDTILQDCGSTSGVDKLSDQVIGKMGNDFSIVKLTAPNFKAGENCDPYFQPAAANSLTKILKSRPQLNLECNSAYRTCVRQCVLYEGYKRNLGYIKLAARTGQGDHEGGVAIDINNWQDWKPVMEREGWDWQGSTDPVHFNYRRTGNTAQKAIAAFQELWNENNRSKPQLEVDGDFGGKTRTAMLESPANGWGKIFNRSLYTGMEGIDVVILAQQLRKMGFLEGAIEHNRFEDQLTLAVCKFQDKQGMTIDGIAGRSTLLAIFPGPNSKFEEFTGT